MGLVGFGLYKKVLKIEEDCDLFGGIKEDLNQYLCRLL
jgi:hypothetical protein